ncbi:hypothetical protein PAAM106076_05065 [Paracoccus aminovorans]
MKSSSGFAVSGRPAASGWPASSKALLTSLTLITIDRTEPSPSSVCQSSVAVTAGSSSRLTSAGAAAAPRPSSRPERISLTAERTTLSPITSTVTVAPDTISACGGFASPAATRPRSAPISPFSAARTLGSGMPIRTMGS